ncbi:Asp-tRNA(Asn)/Glu-tRNA(Gln) amidotransferase GatCAB subunit A [Megasphaera sp. ASD88]|uniref:Asp-tRNA(Asn)/Glu-tRNA(Gln) amidotransferase subunit GatA n=1 Tax=Megasphaera TaxID=906 RepID=UPI000820A3C0|nr:MULTISPECIES: Asp-tRNA(Asn)/Glu-tRNA(Gln) amidotransferase subunit GatA [Megasphaera]MCU6714996.1 Asp-tRNA(Asn)/Glu-tRNA(Gln) amidotransferase subunit GatA [Megasphaera butyrica]PAV39901.1 Asp-tRNA(Asn)/Glu-tRNA(Gln) amidotransferase GatCAB subunit A [Megasphaera sp. ASD88]SCH87580.1 Glutamyl-tRNA(Gln) amidotransferase subunit A [uncultured Megasphaera sp.]SCJ47277.1 Glutamyl-tRNA(Gln) amidotransferase subunit A [uncultured Ruminococcus sp.]
MVTIHGLHDKLVKGELSAVELTKAYIARKDAVEPQVQAFLSDNREFALEAAAAVDKKIAAGEAIADLAGVPGAIKDNICIKGQYATCASKMLKHFKSPYNATVIEKLMDVDYVSLGKTNMDEFAMGSSTENSAFQITHNPWGLDYVPGGSSGGSAAAVAAGECVWSLGSDTGGSVRQPAAYCGVVGLKPTYGLISRYGLIAFASSLDQIGTFTNDVEDCAIVLNAVAGHDAKDSTSIPQARKDYKQALVNDVKGMKIGIPEEFFGEGLDAECRKALDEAIETYKKLGAEIVPVSMPHVKYGIAAYYIIAPAEASSNLARYDGVGFGLRVEGKDIVDMYIKTRSEGFGPEVQRRILLGTYVLSSGYYDAYYLRAMKVRTLIKHDYDEALKQCDVLLTPTAPDTAFKIGQNSGNPLAMYLGDVCTVTLNLAGLPGLSIPCGYKNGLPIGMQLIGKALDEETLLRAAYTFEQNRTDLRKPLPMGEVEL